MTTMIRISVDSFRRTKAFSKKITSGIIRAFGFPPGFYRVLRYRVFWPTGLFFCLPVTDLICWSEHEEYRLLTGFVLRSMS
jgi:hypothetical protein